ncbi:phage tail sheath family protein [Flavilitoribacter nigricans]|uniref:Phage tail protein n=1 Tax=Flavilitoribacter nigricans (strain ATCC 23147 / DSM 23189 / NBRC 102662 / NCIMB 1420 / SS-2) TaxID=1122177 RepID=A0A2D0MYE1_FLAN2|nr:phage tail sheath C-terminal domain-containing protein [Flavilitoribacter nigricans]PHN01265.1 phage tail protein [Flavilitoribacter nigricans DSM 23189 = NBRC 102662]
MPSTYRTPGVYVEEIAKFPPSIAPVATAIPAFISYTQKATRINAGDLHLVPTPVSSMLEYDKFFGGAPNRLINAIHLDANNAFEKADISSNYHSYDSLRSYFQNGGGRCYIISIGKYEDNQNKRVDYLAGLAALRKKDEPTLIVLPDAVGISPGTDLYEVQSQALLQCGELKDRFCILDCRERSSDPSFDWIAGHAEFRDMIGMSNLKYGAAYTPHLLVNVDIPVTYDLIKDKIFRGGVQLTLPNLTNDGNILTNVLPGLSALSEDRADYFSPGLNSLKGSELSVELAFRVLVDTFKTTNDDANFAAIIGKMYQILEVVDTWAANVTFTSLKNDILNLIDAGQPLYEALDLLVKYEKGAESELQNEPAGTYTYYTNPPTITTTQWGNIDISIIPPEPTIYSGGSDDEERRTKALPYLEQLFVQITAGLNTILQYAAAYEKELNHTLYNDHVVYKNLVDSLREQLYQQPPSGAVAGIYARVDNERGVWKSPANVSMLGVKGLTEVIDLPIQDGLNVDPLAGKSINAIRAFTGKGILVWGGRTLAGNDNEWRYISVRRFFNMAEESIKKATESFVFEPNDANTWVRVRAMIENFLILQWRAGALAGSKPEQAFYVHVGIPHTMTAQDVLEGRMIVEIGMAVVRPAEFIILRFSHKMQES